MRILSRLLLAGALMPFLLPAGSSTLLRAQYMVPKHIYDDNADARRDIALAVDKARREHKRVLVDFGGDWCGDCQMLDIYLHRPENWALLNRYYEVVHVSVGHLDKNLDIPIGYGVPIKRGVPAVAVLDARGKVVYASAPGEVENLSRGNSAAIPEFLNKWKA